MNSHELARILLQQPDMPIATHANNHTALMKDAMRIGFLHSWQGDGILIGNFSRMNINHPNEYVTQMIYGTVPTDWARL